MAASRSGTPSALRFGGAAALALALAVSGCSRDATPAPKDAFGALETDRIQIATYGPAEIRSAEGELSLAPKADAEVGFLIGLAEGTAWPRSAQAAAIRFRLESDEPFSLREGEKGAYVYSSTADRRHIVLSRRAPTALVYSPRPGAHRFRIENAQWCADAGRCPANDAAGWTPIAAAPHGEVLVAPYGPATLARTPEGLMVEAVADAEVGFRIRLGDGVAWPRGADAAAVRFRLEGEAPWSISEMADGERRYSNTQRRSFVRVRKAQGEPPLIYARAPGAHALKIDEIVWCGVKGRRCTDESVSWRRLTGEGPSAVYWEPYRSADAKSAVGGRLVARSPVAGVTYGVRLAPLDAGEERVVIVFEVSGDAPTTLRRRRDGAFEYFDPRRGFIALDADDRALFYSEKAGAFNVKVLRTFSCAKSTDWRCRTKEEFLALLPPEREPGSIEGMLELLEWATRNSDFAGSASIVARFDSTSLSAHQIYFKNFERNSAGAYCAGQSVFLARLLRERDYRAFTFNFGILEDDLTHVTTIVASRDNFYLLDSTFGFYLAESGSDRPLDVFAALDGAPFSLRYVNASARDFLFVKSDKRLRVWREKFDVTACGDIKRDGVTVAVCQAPNYGFQVFLYEVGQKLAKAGISADERALISLMRRGVFGVSSPNSAEAQRFVAELARRGVPHVASAPRASSRARYLKESGD